MPIYFFVIANIDIHIVRAVTQTKYFSPRMSVSEDATGPSRLLS